MLNQSFTIDNFRRIFDYENRRGVYLEGRFFPDIEKVTQAIKDCMADIRGLKKKRRTLLPQYYQLQKAILNEEKLKLSAKKEDLLSKELGAICSEISTGNLRINLKSVTIPSGKPAYSIESTAKAYFIIKQVQYNLRKLYKVKQSSRYEIICQLRRVLEDPFPKYVIRTDIKDFYESIPRDGLLRKIDQNALLALPSRKVIRQLLSDYQSLSHSSTGIPRGIGISAYLSELYIRQFDEAVRAHGEIIFYARFVDDIVAIFSPHPNSSVTELLPFLEKEAAALGLELNKSKTIPCDLRQPQNTKLEYLGYEINFGGDDPIKIGLSAKRMTKYKDRIIKSFDAYSKQAGFNEKKARRLLLKRIAFLTGNTRLLNNKANILIGVFYANSLISSADELEEADTELRAQTDAIKAASLKSLLSKFSFKRGFSERRFRQFTPRELAKIVRLWSYEA